MAFHEGNPAVDSVVATFLDSDSGLLFLCEKIFAFYPNIGPCYIATALRNWGLGTEPQSFVAGSMFSVVM